MKLETWLATVLGAAAVGLVATAAQAAPVTGANGTRAPVAQVAEVQPVHWYGRRRYYRPRYYDYGYYHRPRYRYRYYVPASGSTTYRSTTGGIGTIAAGERTS